MPQGKVSLGGKAWHLYRQLETDFSTKMIVCLFQVACTHHFPLHLTCFPISVKCTESHKGKCRDGKKPSTNTEKLKLIFNKTDCSLI